MFYTVSLRDLKRGFVSVKEISDLSKWMGDISPSGETS